MQGYLLVPAWLFTPHPRDRGGCSGRSAKILKPLITIHQGEVVHFSVCVFFRLATFIVASGLAVPSMAASAIVYGYANPNLAGRDVGYLCCDGDVAPEQSPTLVSGLSLVSGQALTFSARGQVSHMNIPVGGDNPDGTVYLDIPINYDDGISAPKNVNRIDALVGVFLGQSSPTGGSTPARLDFVDDLSFLSVAPQVGQMFFIGNGLTGDTSGGDFGGMTQLFIVPAGATRLYLGTIDGSGWAGNTGQFFVEITAVPEPGTWAFLLAGLAALGVRTRRR
jgi:PEP-CTERM motif